MEFSMKQIIRDARAGGITRDHSLDAMQYLDGLEALPVQYIQDADTAEYVPSFENEQLSISRAASIYMQAVCKTEPQLKRCYKELTIRTPEHLEPALLTSDDEFDLLEFNSSINIERTQYLKHPEVIDITNMNLELSGGDSAAAITDHDRNLHSFSATIPVAAKKVVQDLLQSKCMKAEDMESIDEVTDCTEHLLSSPLLAYEEWTLPSPPSLSSLVPRTVIEIEDDAVEGPEEHKIIEHELPVPNGSKDCPFDEDYLERALARISMSPAVEHNRHKKAQSMRIGSPLTPPNSVRPHRRFAAKDPARFMQDMNVQSFQPIYTSSTSTYDRGYQQEIKNALKLVDASIVQAKPRPRLVLLKIQPPGLSNGEMWSSTIKKWSLHSHEESLDELYCDYKSQTLQTPKEAHLSWAPWAPNHFDPAVFYSRYNLVVDEILDNLVNSVQPIDPRTLLYVADGDEDDTELISTIEVTASDALAILMRKRKRAAEEETASITNYRSNRIGQTTAQAFERSLFGMSFDLLANHKKAIDPPRKKKAITASTRLPPSIQPKAVESRSTSSTTARLAPKPLTAPEGIQVIVASSSNSAIRIMRKVGYLLENLQMIERDFTSMVVSQDRTPSDADILISPTCGIIVTSLTEVQQQSLPGDETPTRVRKKIMKLLWKFERLFVIVKTNKEDDQKHHSLHDLQGFVAEEAQARGTTITINCYHNDAFTAEAIMFLLVKYHVPTDTLTLATSEISWEQYLRREFNFNAYTAQVVLHHFHATTGTGGNIFTNLVMMGYEERARVFRDLLGGKNMVRIEKGLLRLDESAFIYA